MKLISHEQMRKEPWTAFAQIQQQAKSSVISVDDDNPAAAPDPIIEGVAAADPLRATLGATIVLALKAKDDALVAAGTIPAVSLDRRIVILSAGAGEGAGLCAALDAAVNCVKSAELTFDEGQNNAPMTNSVGNGTGVSTQVNAALAAAKPSFSVASIINKLEDILAAQAGAHTGVVVVDQETEKVFLYTAPVANEATLLAEIDSSSPSGVDALAAFDVNANPAAASEGQFGE